MRKLFRLSGVAMNVPWFGRDRDTVRLYWDYDRPANAEAPRICTSGSCVCELQYAQTKIEKLEDMGYNVIAVGDP